MKKLKILPSVLMLVACVAILGVGVFAVAPTQNTISGSITINAANNPVEISLFVDGEAVEGYPQTIRSGIEVDIEQDILFDAATVNSINDIRDHVITIKVQNKSTNPLGVFFYQDGTNNKYEETEDGIEANFAKAGNIQTESVIYANSDGDIIKAMLTPYLYCAPESNSHLFDVAEMNIRLSMETFTSTQVNKTPFSFDLRIEPYVENVTTAELNASAGEAEPNDEDHQLVFTESNAKIDKKFIKLPRTGLTALKALQFYNHSNLEYIVIPNNVTKVETYEDMMMQAYGHQFLKCYNLKWISVCSYFGVKDDSTDCVPGAFSIDNGPQQTNVYINGITQLSSGAFYFDSINILEISSSCTSFSQEAYPNSSINVLIIPEISNVFNQIPMCWGFDKLVLKRTSGVQFGEFVLYDSDSVKWSYAGANGEVISYAGEIEGETYGCLANLDVPEDEFERTFYKLS